LAKFPLLTKLEKFDVKCKNELIFGVFNQPILKKIVMRISKFLYFVPVVRIKKYKMML